MRLSVAMWMWWRKLRRREHCRDPISVADFVLHGYVTYPYTVYKFVKQLPPGSVNKF